MNGFTREFEFWYKTTNTSKVTKKLHNSRNKMNVIKRKNTKAHDVLKVETPFPININAIKIFLINKNMLPMFHIILTDMYECDFKNTSSVNNTMKNISGDYEILKDVNLEYHSFKVANKISNKINVTAGLLADYYFLCALVHDFGKSKILKDKYKISNSIKHHKASANYLKKIKELVSNKCYESVMLDSVIRVIDKHHDDDSEEVSISKAIAQKKEKSDTERIDRLLMSALVEADSEERVEELEQFKKNVF